MRVKVPGNAPGRTLWLGFGSPAHSGLEDTPGKALRSTACSPCLPRSPQPSLPRELATGLLVKGTASVTFRAGHARGGLNESGTPVLGTELVLFLCLGLSFLRLKKRLGRQNLLRQ